jgi:hypothetical protein
VPRSLSTAPRIPRKPLAKLRPRNNAGHDGLLHFLEDVILHLVILLDALVAATI